ncbi:MAG: hypothetical protein JW936_11455 [Sedimentisphaerales bacterium]|nr:hypothetical protein [Sedimentisphaerales bacterium]
MEIDSTKDVELIVLGRSCWRNAVRDALGDCASAGWAGGENGQKTGICWVSDVYGALSRAVQAVNNGHGAIVAVGVDVLGRRDWGIFDYLSKLERVSSVGYSVRGTRAGLSAVRLGGTTVVKLEELADAVRSARLNLAVVAPAEAEAANEFEAGLRVGGADEDMQDDVGQTAEDTTGGLANEREPAAYETAAQESVGQEAIEQESVEQELGQGEAERVDKDASKDKDDGKRDNLRLSQEELDSLLG